MALGLITTEIIILLAEEELMLHKTTLTLGEEQILQFKTLKEEIILHQQRIQITRKPIEETLLIPPKREHTSLALQVQVKELTNQAHRQVVETLPQEALAHLEAVATKAALAEEVINIKKYIIS